MTAGGEVHLSGTLTCAGPDDVRAIAHHVAAHVAASRAEPGCLAFDLWQTDDPMVWQVRERFASAAAFAAHQRRTRASAWWAATGHIPRRFTVTGAA